MAFFAKRSTRAVIKNDPRIVEIDREHAPEKILIVTSHPFGSALKLILLGAVAGAGATFFLLRGRAAPSPARAKDAVAEGLSAGGAKDERALLSRLTSVLSRLKSVAGAVRGVAEFAGDTLGPAVSAAMSEGRRAAHEVEAELKRDLEDAKSEAEDAAKAEAKAAPEKKRDEH